MLTDDVPSCSTSPSTNNCVVIPQQVLNRSQQRNAVPTDNTPLPAATILNPCPLDVLASSPKAHKQMSKSESNVKPSISVPKLQNHGVVAPQTYPNNGIQMDYLDTTSSATSACLSQADGSLQQSFPLSSFNQTSIFRDAAPDSDLHANDLRNNLLFGVNIDGPLGIPLTTEPLLANSIDSGKYQGHMPGGIIGNYSTSKDAQQELSSSMVSQSFGVPDMPFNSIDSTMNESSLLNRSSWALAPQYQRRTYTKVCYLNWTTLKCFILNMLVSDKKNACHDFIKWLLYACLFLDSYAEDFSNVCEVLIGLSSSYGVLKITILI